MKPFKLVAISGIILFFLWSNPVFAEMFNIPPGPLEQALDAYAETTGRNLVYMNALVAGKNSAGVTGNVSATQAMDKILAGTGLTFTLNNQEDMVLKEETVSSAPTPPKQPTQKKDIATAEPRSMQMDQIVVTATKTPVKTKEVPAAVNVVSDEDIKFMPGADSYYDAIRNVPGVNIRQEGTSESIILRGMVPSILHDGRDMNPFVTSTSMITSSMNMGMNSIERIEVIKGPQAAIHGSKAVSGVVNVIRKRGNKNEPFAEVYGFLGTSEEANGGVSLGGGFDNLSYFIDFSASKQDEYKTPKGSIPYMDYERKNLFARLDYTFSDNHELTFDYTNNRSENTQGGEGYYYEESDWNKIYHNEPEYQGAFLTYNGTFSDIFSLYAIIGSGKNDFVMVYGGPEEERFLNKESETFFEEAIWQGELRGTLTLLDGRLKSIVGLQYKNTDMDGYSDKTKDGEKERYYTWDADEKYLAPYAQVEFKPISHLLLVSGVRYGDYDSGGKKMSATNPNIGLSVFPFASTNYNWTTLWASYSKSFRTPTAAQRYLPDFLGGNPDLNPEKSKGWEVGLKQRIGRWAEMEINYFETDYDDLIRMILAGDKWETLNIGKAKYKGYEVLLEVYPTDWLILHLGFNDIDREDTLKGKKLTGQPNQMLQYGLTIPDLYGFSFSLWGYQDKDFKYSEDEAHPSENDIIWDTKLLYQWAINEKLSLQPFISIENLTDKTHYNRHYDRGIMEERTTNVGATLRMTF